MLILVTEKPAGNAYIESLMVAYKRAGHTVFGDVSNFFHSNAAPDLLHIHWPERLHDWYPHRTGSDADWRDVIETRLKWYKANNTTIVHTVHNLRPHESHVTNSLDIFRLIISYADIIVHHCENSVRLVADAYPESRARKNIICPHGDYLISYRHVDRIEARRKLNLPENSIIILNFGRQRPYKNEQLVVSAFNKMTFTNKYLVIAGEFVYPPSGAVRRLVSRLRNHIRETIPMKSIRYIYNKFSDDEMAEIISASDILFLGQQHALNSGVLPLAATYKRPVVYPDIGCFGESMEGWRGEKFEAGDAAEAARKLDKMCRALADNGSGESSNAAWLERNSWRNHVGTILNCIGR